MVQLRAVKKAIRGETGVSGGKPATSARILFLGNSIAENVPGLNSQADKDKFKAAVKELLAVVKGDGTPTVYVRSSFWPDGTKDGILKQVCAETGATFVDISRLASDPKHYARSERQFSHDGVAAHPGDASMAAIANALWSAVIEKK